MLHVAILGAGEFSRELLDGIEACQKAGQAIEVVGIVAEDRSRWGTLIDGRPVLEGLDWFDEKPGRRDVHLIGGWGIPALRHWLVLQALRRGLQFCTVVHPSAHVSSRASLGVGVTMLASTVIESQARIGDHVIINNLSFVGHDSVIDDFCTLAPGSLIAGNVHLGQGVDFGIGAASKQGIRIGEGAIIGGHAMIVRDVPANATVVGVPGKVIKVRQPGWAAKTDDAEGSPEERS